MASKLLWDYPMEDPSDWLVFKNPNHKNIDPIFMWRLAALGKYFNKKINISSGRRTTKEQIAAYRQSGGYLDSNGNWTGGNGLAAKPGYSWHEYGEAVDVSDSWLKNLDKNESTENQKTLMKFGIFKPLTPGNKSSVHEDWHIQPIETKNVPVEQRKSFLSFEEGAFMKDLIVNGKKHWAAEIINKAVEEGIVKGIEQPDGTVIFKPDAPITRAETVVLVMRVLDKIKKMSQN